MQTIDKSDYPGQCSMVLMPMIDMKANDESCILSTMLFVANQAKKFNLSPILTFDQPLFQQMLETIYADHSVPHMLSGKAISN